MTFTPNYHLNLIKRNPFLLQNPLLLNQKQPPPSKAKKKKEGSTESSGTIKKVDVLANFTGSKTQTLSEVLGALEKATEGFQIETHLPDRNRCRYPNVLCPKDSCVTTKADGSYLHANFVQLVEGTRFIAAQCPSQSEEQKSLFLEAYHEQQASLIIDLTQGIAQGVMGNIYLTETVGHIDKVGEETTQKTITCLSAEDLKDISSTKRFTYKLDGHENEIHRLHFGGWPDHGICSEEDFDSLITIIENETGTVIVHCSAGIGRTGTLIVGYSLLQLIKQGLIKDEDELFQAICQLILNGRLRRGKLFVQSEAQFEFIWKKGKEALQKYKS